MNASTRRVAAVASRRVRVTLTLVTEDMSADAVLRHVLAGIPGRIEVAATKVDAIASCKVEHDCAMDIYRLRTERRLKLREIAALTNVSVSTCGRICAGVPRGGAK